MRAAFRQPRVSERAGEETKLQRLGKVNLLMSAALALPASPHRSAACKTHPAESWSLSQSAYAASTRHASATQAEGEGRGTMRQC